MKIIAPNQFYEGTTAGVRFSEGVGETADPHKAEWFREHGYTVEDERPPADKKDKKKAEEKQDGNSAEKQDGEKNSSNEG